MGIWLKLLGPKRESFDLKLDQCCPRATGDHWNMMYFMIIDDQYMFQVSSHLWISLAHHPVPPSPCPVSPAPRNRFTILQRTWTSSEGIVPWTAWCATPRQLEKDLGDSELGPSDPGSLIFFFGEGHGENMVKTLGFQLLSFRFAAKMLKGNLMVRSTLISGKLRGWRESAENINRVEHFQRPKQKIAGQGRLSKLKPKKTVGGHLNHFLNSTFWDIRWQTRVIRKIPWNKDCNQSSNSGDGFLSFNCFPLFQHDFDWLLTNPFRLFDLCFFPVGLKGPPNELLAPRVWHVPHDFSFNSGEESSHKGWPLEWILWILMMFSLVPVIIRLPPCDLLLSPQKAISCFVASKRQSWRYINLPWATPSGPWMDTNSSCRSTIWVSAWTGWIEGLVNTEDWMKLVAIKDYITMMYM